MTITLYGIPNCDTVRRARQWLDARGLAYHFHDTKKSGVDAALLTSWITTLGLDRVLNRAGTTFRKLPDADKAGIDVPKAIALMIAQPSLIKRPILAHPGGLLAGFDEALWLAALA